MKKLLSLLMTLSFALSLATATLAETKAAPVKPVEPMKQAEAKKEKSHQITGIVEAVDDAAGTLTVKGKKESVRLKVSDEVNLEKIQVGDKVLANYTGDTASSVKKISGKKAEPKETAEPAKKDIAPAAPAEKK